MTIPASAVTFHIGEQEYYSMLAFEATIYDKTLEAPATLHVRFIEGRKNCCCCGHSTDRYGAWTPLAEAIERGWIVKVEE